MGQTIDEVLHDDLLKLRRIAVECTGKDGMYLRDYLYRTLESHGFLRQICEESIMVESTLFHVESIGVRLSNAGVHRSPYPKLRIAFRVQAENLEPDMSLETYHVRQDAAMDILKERLEQKLAQPMDASMQRLIEDKQANTLVAVEKQDAIRGLDRVEKFARSFSGIFKR